MAPMGVRLSPLGIGVLALLALAVVYHLYSGFLGGRFAALLLPSAAGTGRTELRALLTVSVLAAQRGGEQVRRVRQTGSLREQVKGKTREGIDEKFTDGDDLSNRQMYFTLLNAFPDLQIHSEEHIGQDEHEPVSWDGIIPDDVLKAIPEAKEVHSDSVTIWIDPLDATEEYTENLLKYVTTMVCVAVDGRPIIGVIHKPFSSYTAWAMVGGGSNLKPRSAYNAAKPIFIVSRSHTGTVQDVIRQTFGNDTVILKAGGSGYKVLSLLDVLEEEQEKADIYVHKTFIKKWDICAGNALLEALGGQMTTLKGEQIQYTGSNANEEGVLASIGMNHSILVKKLAGKIPDVLKKAQ